jgi:hypothetical protein
MRQVHRAGEKLFVDYAGQHPRVIEPETGAHGTRWMRPHASQQRVVMLDATFEQATILSTTALHD